MKFPFWQEVMNRLYKIGLKHYELLIGMMEISLWKKEDITF